VASNGKGRSSRIRRDRRRHERTVEPLLEALNQGRVRGAPSAPQTGARRSNWDSSGLRQARLRHHFRLWKMTYHDLTVKMGESGRVRLKWPGIADRFAVVDEKPLRCLRRNPSRKPFVCWDISRHQVSGREPEPALSCIIRLGVRVVVCSGSVIRCVEDDHRYDPMFRHRSATPAGDTGNGIVRSLGDNGASIPKIGRQRVSQTGDCQHHGGREPAVGTGSINVKCR
jgi:hypothetical protein